MGYIRMKSDPVVHAARASGVSNIFLDVSEEGDSIEVRPGIYKENIFINKSVELRGLPTSDGKVGVRIESEGLSALDISKGTIKISTISFLLKAPTDAKFPATVLVRGNP